LNRDGKRRPRILFLADRNILADQTFNSFSAFPEDAMVRIKPKEVKVFPVLVARVNKILFLFLAMASSVFLTAIS
jgi:type I site-specific restriction endonuclease